MEVGFEMDVSMLGVAGDGVDNRTDAAIDAELEGPPSPAVEPEDCSEAEVFELAVLVGEAPMTVAVALVEPEDCSEAEVAKVAVSAGEAPVTVAVAMVEASNSDVDCEVPEMLES